jgi:hypothetical protein
MPINLESCRQQPTRRRKTSGEVDHAIALPAEKMIVMWLAGRLVAGWRARHIHGNNLLTRE